MREQNYYLLLGLSFDPPETDEAVIRAAIRRYTGAATDADRDERYLLAADMNGLLLDQARADERLQEAERAAGIVYEPLDEIIRSAAYMSNPPAMSLAWTDRIAEVSGFAPSIVERRMKRSGKLVLPLADAPERMDRELMDSIRSAFRVAQVQSLNEYLLRYMPAGGCTAGEVWNQPRLALYDAVNAALKQGRSPEEKRMAEILLRFFNDDGLRRQYEAELEMAPVYELADRTEALDRAGLLVRSRDGAMKIYEQIKQHVPGDQRAMKLYKALFFQPLAMPMPDKARMDRDAVVCCGTCGTLQRVSRHSKMLCSICKSPLNCRCETCGQWFAATEKEAACPNCGRSRRMALRVRELMRRSEDARKSGMKELAARYRSDALQLDAGLAAEIADEQDAQLTDQIRRLQEEHRFYALRELMERERKGSGWEEIYGQACDAIACAESMFTRLYELEEPMQYQCLRAAAALCRDIPDFPARIASYVPPAPANVCRTCRDGRFELTWEYPPRPEATFCLARRTETGGEVRYDMVSTGLTGTQCSVELPEEDGYYALRAELFGAVSEWISAGLFVSSPGRGGLHARLTPGGMQITWPKRMDGERLLLSRNVHGHERELAHLPDDADGYLDTDFDRNGTARYRLSGEKRKHGGRIVSAGMPEKAVWQDEAEGSLPDRCVYRYEPDRNTEVAWRVGGEDDQPLRPGVYAEEELEAVKAEKFIKAASGRMVCRPLNCGGGFIQPIWRGGGCLRVGQAIFPSPNVEPFREVSCTRVQKGLYRIEAQWPDRVNSAVITACATRYAKPGVHCGEIELRIPFAPGKKLEAVVPWVLTEQALIAVRAVKKAGDAEYYSEAYRIPVKTSAVTWRISDQSGRRWLHIGFEAAEHMTYRPPIDVLSSRSGARIRAVEAGVLYAGRPWSVMRELPGGDEWDQAVWGGADHDWFCMIAGKERA